jgi:hypothetical protein
LIGDDFGRKVTIVISLAKNARKKQNTRINKGEMWKKEREVFAVS